MSPDTPRNTVPGESEGRAISAVVGIAITVGIAVVLASVVGALALSTGPSGDPGPTVHFVATYACNDDATPDRLRITHNGGQNIDTGPLTLAFTNVSGHRVLRDVDARKLTAGEQLIIENLADDGLGKDTTVTLLRVSSDRRTQAVDRWKISKIALNDLNCLENSGSISTATPTTTPTSTPTPTPTPVPTSTPTPTATPSPTPTPTPTPVPTSTPTPTPTPSPTPNPGGPPGTPPGPR